MHIHVLAQHSGGCSLIPKPTSDVSIPSLPNSPPSVVASCISQALSWKCCGPFGQPSDRLPSPVRRAPCTDSFLPECHMLFFSLPYPSPPSLFQAFHLGHSNKISFIHTISRCYCHPPRSQAPANPPHSSLSLLSHLIMARVNNLT